MMMMIRQKVNMWMISKHQQFALQYSSSSLQSLPLPASSSYSSLVSLNLIHHLRTHFIESLHMMIATILKILSTSLEASSSSSSFANDQDHNCAGCKRLPRCGKSNDYPHDIEQHQLPNSKSQTKSSPTKYAINTDATPPHY